MALFSQIHGSWLSFLFESEGVVDSINQSSKKEKGKRKLRWAEENK
jgi:hypothetical protein